jgi:hypothetical protein
MRDGVAAPGRKLPGAALLVEAGGQRVRGFRRGLDYAFVRTLQIECMDAERVIRLLEPAGS